MKFAAVLAVVAVLLTPGLANAYDQYDDCCWLYVTGYSVAQFPGGGAFGFNQVGKTMACPRWLGPEIEDIEGIGRRTCSDHYAAGLSDRRDILTYTVAEAYAMTGCHRWRPITVNYVIPPQTQYVIPDHHCDNYRWQTPPQYWNYGE